MTTRRVPATVLGYTAVIDYSPRWVGHGVLALRVAMGWTLYQAGVARLLDPQWSIARFVAGIPAGTPVGDGWAWLASALGWVLGPLLCWGCLLAGLGLIFGAFLRASVLLGGVTVLLTWTARLPAEGSFLSPHVVYLCVFLGLGAFGAGRLAGLDAIFERHPIVDRYPRLRLLMG